jgi:molybdopterin-guanine dinucleotide biosynthesis protein A
MATDVIAIVLAGGASRRMGPLVGPGGKAALAVGGESMLGRVCRTLGNEAGRVVVVAAAGQPLPPLAPQVEVVRDTRPGAGPLAALHDGLVHAGAGPRIAVVASCDVPGLLPGVARRIVAAAREPGVRWAVPVVGGHAQVLLSALATDLVGTIREALATGCHSPRRLFDDLARSDPGSIRMLSEHDFTAIDPRLGSFTDIDTPDDLAAGSSGGDT